MHIRMSAFQQDKHVNDSKLKQRSHQSASYYMMWRDRQIERERERLRFDVWAVFWVSTFGHSATSAQCLIRKCKCGGGMRE